MWSALKVNVGAGMKLDFGWRGHGYYCMHSTWTLAATSSFTKYLHAKDSTLGSTSLLLLMLKLADMGSHKTSLKFFVHK